VDRGFITVPEGPGLGIEGLDDAVLAEHTATGSPPPWQPTDTWDGEWSNDRLWS